MTDAHRNRLGLPDPNAAAVAACTAITPKALPVRLRRSRTVADHKDCRYRHGAGDECPVIPTFEVDPEDCDHGRWNPDNRQCLDCGHIGPEDLPPLNTAP